MTTYPLQPVNSGVSADSRGSLTTTQALLLVFALLVLAALLGGRGMVSRLSRRGPRRE